MDIDTNGAKFTAAFIFQPGTYDDEFHELDAQIDAYAKALDGYVKTERWGSDDGKIRNSVYYFKNREAIALLARFEPHRVAKKNYAKWYKGYRIEVSEITQVYGDGNL
jgi:hypothetical protein